MLVQQIKKLNNADDEMEDSIKVSWCVFKWEMCYNAFFPFLSSNMLYKQKHTYKIYVIMQKKC